MKTYFVGPCEASLKCTHNKCFHEKKNKKISQTYPQILPISFPLLNLYMLVHVPGKEN